MKLSAKKASKAILSTLTAVSMLSCLSLSWMPFNSNSETAYSSVFAAGKSVSNCDYQFDVDAVIGGVEDKDKGLEKDQYVLDLSSVPAGSVIEEVIVEVDTGSDSETAMIAIGCNVKGYNEYDWYSDSGQSTGKELVFSYTFDKEIGSLYGKDFNELYIQHWWGGDNGDNLVTVKRIGVNVSGGTGSALKGDFNQDKKITVSDLVVFSEYMTGSISGDYYDAVADYNSDGLVNIVDFIEMKYKFVKMLDSGISDDGQTAIDFVQNITIGWNLGNTLDSTASWISNASPAQFETAWGNPVTTKEMIDTIKKQGFNTVRVPVSWGEKMGPAPNYTVSEEWMNRVNEVVDYVIDNDMYCILNVHHDNDWLVPTNAKYSAASDQLTHLWAQICERFKNYDEKLIFETMNEPRLVGSPLEWNGGDSESRQCINKLNQDAVDAIRKTGGNNAKRYIMCPTYAAAATNDTLNDYVVPDDPRVIVSIHSYSPYFFALADESVQGQTTKWGSDSDEREMENTFKTLYNRFIANGNAVIIGEFGALNKNNDESRVKWAESYIRNAKKYKIRCVWWDNNLFQGEGEKFGLLDRQRMTIVYPDIVEAMLKGLQ